VQHDLASSDDYIALKWAADDREGWRYMERMSKTCSTGHVFDTAQ